MKKIIFLASAIALFFGCTNEENVTQSSNDMKIVTAQADAIVVGSLDNTSFRDYVVPAEANAVYWKAGDEIALVQDDGGVFQGSGNHHPYTYDSSKGLQEQVCQGHFTRNMQEDHEPGTVTGGTYIVVYPYNSYAQDEYKLVGGKLHFDFPAQTQLSNGSLDNFGPTDFMYSSLFNGLQKEYNTDITETKGSANFQLQHAMTWIKLTVNGLNTGEIISYITITATDPIFFGAIELAPNLTTTFVNPKDVISLNTSHYTMLDTDKGTYSCWITINKLAAGATFTINVITDQGSWPFKKTASATGLVQGTAYLTTLTLPSH